jgi:hypothetical protein
MLRQLFHMHLDSVAIRASRILDFFDGNFVARFRQVQNLAGKGGQGRVALAALSPLRPSCLSSSPSSSERRPTRLPSSILAHRLLGAAQGEVD